MVAFYINLAQYQNQEIDIGTIYRCYSDITSFYMCGLALCKCSHVKFPVTTTHTYRTVHHHKRTPCEIVPFGEGWLAAAAEPHISY